MANINVYGTFNSMAEDQTVAKANQIYDDTEQKMQSSINSENKSLLTDMQSTVSSLEDEVDNINIDYDVEEQVGTTKKIQLKDKESNTLIPNVRMYIDDDGYDFCIVDDNDNILLVVDDGNIILRNFDSRQSINLYNSNNDYEITDGNGNSLLKITNGEIITSNVNTYSLDKGNVTMYVQKEINSYVGDNLQIFKYPLTLLGDYANYMVTLSVDSTDNNEKKMGRTLRRYFQFTPTTTNKSYNIIASVVDRRFRVHWLDTFKINVITPTNPSTKKNILVIGDSSVQGNTNNSGISVAQGASEEGVFGWTNEAKRLLTTTDSTDGLPTGLGLTNFQFIGTQNTSGGRNEGYGGKDVQWFYGSSSPFYKSGAVNFNTYLGQTSVYEDTSRKGVDLIYICLGGNNSTFKNVDKEHLMMWKKDYKTQMRTFLDYIINQLIKDSSKTYYNPNLKIVLLNSSFGWISGNGYHPYGSSQWGDGIGIALGRVLCWEANKELSQETAYSPYVETYLTATQIDAENSYAYINKPVNNYSSVTEVENIENVHMNRAGQRMYGAAVVRNILGRF